MTVRLGADGTSSDVAELKALGATFISRYVSDFPSKNLTLAEAQTLSDAGIDIVTNWEDDVNSWQGGYNRGVQDATRAWHQHKACGGPDGRPVYFSVDTDCDPNDFRLHEYFRGVGAGMTPGQAGVYGSTAVCQALKAAGLVSWTWRTMSTGWRGGAGSPDWFNVEQTGYFNSTYDRDASITEDFGQWRVGQVPGPAPTPVPQVSLHDIQGSAHADPPAPQGVTTNFVQVSIVQRALVSEGFLQDSNPWWGRGCFGTMTIAAYAKWQEKLGYSGTDADGIPGWVSLSKLASAHGFRVVL